MTIQEIRDLIAKKIAGQGTQVDVGGGLAAILNGILDAIENASPILSIHPSNFFGRVSKSEAAGNLGISEEEFDRLMGGGYPAVKIESESTFGYDGLFPVYVENGDYPIVYIIWGDLEARVQVVLYIQREQDGTYSLSEI